MSRPLRRSLCPQTCPICLRRRGSRRQVRHPRRHLQTSRQLVLMLFAMSARYPTAASAVNLQPPMPPPNGPLAVEIPRPPLLPIASPRLRLLRNLERPCARRSAAALSEAFCSSCRARESLSASSLRTAFGLNRPVEGPRIARVVPRRTVLGPAAAASEPAGVASPAEAEAVSVVSVVEALVAPAEAAPLRPPLAVARPRTMSLVGL